MPELPEVETIARTLAPQITGKRLTSVHVLHAKSLQDGHALLPCLHLARITRVFRRAKLLLLAVLPDPIHNEPHSSETAGLPTPQAVPSPFAPQELALAFHLKMTGRFFVHPEAANPLKHTRLIFDLSGADSADGPPVRLFFDDMRTFGYCRIMRPRDLPLWPFWAGLGPEPLNSAPEHLATALAKAFSRRNSAVKALLLDQTIVAGIGNIYADEALFRAGIAPAAKAKDLAPAQILDLTRAVQDILALSIKECGSSIRDYRDALGNAGAFQNNFAVYGRKGLPCPLCAAPLSSARIAGRATVFCSHCQK